MFASRNSRRIEPTSSLVFMLTWSSSSGCKYSEAFPDLTSASFVSICDILSRYNLQQEVWECQLKQNNENAYVYVK